MLGGKGGLYSFIDSFIMAILYFINLLDNNPKNGIAAQYPK